MVSVILLTVCLCIRQVNVKKVIMITLSVLLALESLLGMSTLSSMVRDVNSSQLAREEILSDHVYYYSLETDQITM